MLSFSLPVFAQEDVDIYTVVLPVENQSKPQQQAAFEIALHEVIDALSANTKVKSDADLSKLFVHPEYYVESYSYLSDPEQPDALQIIVHFDRQALRPFFPQQHAVQSQRLDLQVSGITSAQTLNAMTHYLSQISAIKSVIIKQVSNDNVTLSVELQGNVSGLIQILLTSQHFISLSTEDSQDLEEQSALRFNWVGE